MEMKTRGIVKREEEEEAGGRWHDGGFGCRSAAPAGSLEMEAIGIN